MGMGNTFPVAQAIPGKYGRNHGTFGVVLTLCGWSIHVHLMCRSPGSSSITPAPWRPWAQTHTLTRCKPGAKKLAQRRGALPMPRAGVADCTRAFATQPQARRWQHRRTIVQSSPRCWCAKRIPLTAVARGIPMSAASLGADAPKDICECGTVFCQIQNYGAMTVPATLNHIARLAPMSAPR